MYYWNMQYILTRNCLSFYSGLLARYYKKHRMICLPRLMVLLFRSAAKISLRLSDCEVFSLYDSSKFKRILHITTFFVTTFFVVVAKIVRIRQMVKIFLCLFSESSLYPIACVKVPVAIAAIKILKS